MTDPNTSPVSLPAGSYDYDALHKGLDGAAKGKISAYDESIAKALETAAADDRSNNDPRTIPGYKFVDVENKELGVTENVQVFDAKLAEKQGEAAGTAPEAETTTPASRASAKPSSTEE